MRRWMLWTWVCSGEKPAANRDSYTMPSDPPSGIKADHQLTVCHQVMNNTERTIRYTTRFRPEDFMCGSQQFQRRAD